jgi:hypothetical protein
MLELTRQSPNPDYIAELSRLALAAERGQCEDLECPSCHAEKVCMVHESCRGFLSDLVHLL